MLDSTTNSCYFVLHLNWRGNCVICESWTSRCCQVHVLWRKKIGVGYWAVAIRYTLEWILHVLRFISGDQSWSIFCIIKLVRITSLFIMLKIDQVSLEKENNHWQKPCWRFFSFSFFHFFALSPWIYVFMLLYVYICWYAAEYVLPL